MIDSKPRPHKLYTLIVPVDVENRRVLLGYKKRGFGEGKYNGFGGKVEPGETILDGAIRELEEESTLKAKGLNYHAILFLETIADPKAPILEIHTYTATEWTGEPAETEEMRPGWYNMMNYETSTPSIPYSSMWEETRKWLPEVLRCFTTSDPEKGEKTQFIHYVIFTGDINPETGKYDVWHGMGETYVKWFDEGKKDVGFPSNLWDWTDQHREKWVENRRTEYAAKLAAK
ncbi:hypothetical protein RUND412_001807 [Rhizina undulata]